MYEGYKATKDPNAEDSDDEGNTFDFLRSRQRAAWADMIDHNSGICRMLEERSALPNGLRRWIFPFGAF